MNHLIHLSIQTPDTRQESSKGEIESMKKTTSPLALCKLATNDQEAESRSSGRSAGGAAAALTKKGSESEAAAAAKKLESKASMDINESAEAFINKFKQQLLLQRLESIENYEQMLARSI